ncbi:MAG: IS1380 family transposase, partial [Candidatus Hydrogenedentes bacterium]|nr:IS1380 family transposase [Candidatus Hydrogenedentota bacterium]
GAAGAIDEVARIVAQIRARWPKVRIVLRGDSGFCREELMAWCEEGGVGYVFGLAPNERLKAVLAPEAWDAERRCETTGKAARVFKDFAYQTEKTWSRARRVVGKAEHLPPVNDRGNERGNDRDGANPRFVVTSLSTTRIDAQALYENLYCARGEMENRIKEQQLDLFADRTSSATMKANQLRLWFSSMAYVLLNELRRIALRHTQFADATCGTIRLKLLKIGALVRRSMRRIKFAMASGFPWRNEFALAYVYLERAFPR